MGEAARASSELKPWLSWEGTTLPASNPSSDMAKVKVKIEAKEREWDGQALLNLVESFKCHKQDIHLFMVFSACLPEKMLGTEFHKKRKKILFLADKGCKMMLICLLWIKRPDEH